MYGLRCHQHVISAPQWLRMRSRTASAEGRSTTCRASSAAATRSVAPTICHISTSVAPHEIPDGIGRRQVNSLPSKLGRGRQVSGPYYLLHGSDRRRADRQLAHAEAEQQRNRERVGGKLAAYSGPAARIDGRSSRAPYQGKDSWMQSVAEACYRGHLAVCGQRVLSEVVCADREEVHGGRQPCGRQGSGRDLDH